jgi:hypothetical protein
MSPEASAWFMTGALYTAGSFLLWLALSKVGRRWPMTVPHKRYRILVTDIRAEGAFNRWEAKDLKELARMPHDIVRRSVEIEE